MYLVLNTIGKKGYLDLQIAQEWYYARYTTQGLNIQSRQNKISAIFGLLQPHIWPPSFEGEQI